MRVLILTKIYPNSLEPLSAPFNRQQFGALARLCDVEILATIPYLPGGSFASRWAPAARLGAVPREETIGGLRVRHPRFAYVPRIGRGFTGALYAASLLPVVRRYAGWADVILGSWAYPDGYAATLLARSLGVPAVVKLHGSDINVLGELAPVRPRLRSMFGRVERVAAVSGALAEKAIALGAPRDRTHVVANGVDTSRFHPRDRAASRRALGQPEAGSLIVYVGRLEEAKGVIDLVEAFARIAANQPSMRLALIGEGASRARAQAIVASAGLGSRVVFAGACPHDRVAQWVGACDALALPSWNEGTPNVVLEALASGRRVVATAVGGIPAVVQEEALGELVAARDRGALGDALARAARRAYDPADVLKRAGVIGWSESAERLRDVLSLAVEERKGALRGTNAVKRTLGARS